MNIDLVQKLHKCKCGAEYKKYTTMQNCCVDCLAVKIIKNRVRSEKSTLQLQKRELTKEKKANKKRLIELLTKGDWTKKVDAVYNPFIRLRDEQAGLPCPSCNRYDHEIPDNPHGKWDCGHYLGKGAFPELRWVEINTWRQCKSCNGGSGKYAKKNHTVSQSYRINLIERIGLDKVEWLEGPHEPNGYRIPELIELEQFYKAKYKELLKNDKDNI